MRAVFITVSLLILFSGCSTSRLVDQYVNADAPHYEAKKVLVVGLTPDGGLQRQFEYSLVKALEDHNVQAVKSVDIFGEPFPTSDEGSEIHWESLEAELLGAGFDAVLFSKITGKESRVTLAQSYRNLVRTFETFSDYYKENQPVYEGQIEDYPVLNTETSLYCLCPARKNDLIWRGNIDIVNSPGAQKSIADYVKTLIRTLKRNQLLIKQ